MKLSEIFSQLTYGEFSQLNIGGADKGQIDESNYPAVVAHINLGLTALYRRFPLKEGRLLVELQPNQGSYELESRFAVNSNRSNEPIRYIKDDPGAPFRDDILKIERVVVDSGRELPVNQNGDPWSVNTPKLTQIVLPRGVVFPTNDTPDDLKTANVTVVYRANHPFLVLKAGFIDTSHTNIELPYSHLEALLYFVASRAHNPVGMQNEFHKGNSYAAKYEAVCAELEYNNVKPDPMYENMRLVRNGWV